MAVNGFQVEPAAYWSATALLIAGLRLLVFIHLMWPRTVLVWRLVNQFGLKFGAEAMPTMAPVCTSMATIAPESAVPTLLIPHFSASSSARWVLASMVSRRLKPLTGAGFCTGGPTGREPASTGISTCPSV